MRIVATAILGLFLVSLHTADAATVAGRTLVEITAPLCCSGLSLAPSGATSAEGTVLSAPITGGLLDGLDPVRLDHEGAGARLTDLNGSFLDAARFSADFEKGQVRGDLLGALFSGGDPLFEFARLDALIFSLGPLTENGWLLRVGTDLSEVFKLAFGLDVAVGAEIGFLRAEPQVSRVAPVPLPAAGWMLLAAVGGLAMLRRRAA